jgi:tetratricopeptide (TPR) repeat protein
MRLFGGAGGRRKVAYGVVAATLLCVTTACSNGSKPAAAGSGDAKALLSKALNDYYGGNPQLAKSEFQMVVDKDPNNKYGWFNLGVLAENDNDTKTATTDYQKALAIDAAYEPALYNYGYLTYLASDWKGAIALLERAVAANPNDASAHWNLGLALAHLHAPAGYKRSRKELNIAIKLNPNLLPKTGGVSGASGASGSTGARGASGATG